MGTGSSGGGEKSHLIVGRGVGGGCIFNGGGVTISFVGLRVVGAYKIFMCRDYEHMSVHQNKSNTQLAKQYNKTAHKN